MNQTAGQVPEENYRFVLLGLLSSPEVKDFLYGEDPSFVHFQSGCSQMAWIMLQNNHLQHSMETMRADLVSSRNFQIYTLYTYGVVFTVLKKATAKIRAETEAKKRREERERVAKVIGFVKVFSKTTVTMSLLFLFANKVSASDFPGNSFPSDFPGPFQNEPLPVIAQEKQRLLLRNAVLLTLGIAALGGAGYLLSSRAVPYFVKLAPRLKEIKETWIPPVIEVVTILPTLPDAFKVLDFVPVPKFLKIPFSQDLSTLSSRISETLEFFSVIEGDPLFTLERHRDKSFKLMELMSEHIDNLSVLARSADRETFVTKVALLNEALMRVCAKNVLLESTCNLIQHRKIDFLKSKLK